MNKNKHIDRCDDDDDDDQYKCFEKWNNNVEDEKEEEEDYQNKWKWRIPNNIDDDKSKWQLVIDMPKNVHQSINMSTLKLHDPMHGWCRKTTAFNFRLCFPSTSIKMDERNQYTQIGIPHIVCINFIYNCICCCCCSYCCRCSHCT